MIVDLARRRRTRPTQPPNQNKIALQLTGRDYLSYSAVSTYQRCPLKYYFSYIAGVAAEFVSSSLVFGGAIHSALECYYRRLIEGRDTPEADELVAEFEKSWKSNSTAKVRFGKNETADSLRDLAHRMLKAFLDSPLSRPDATILGIEEELRSETIEDCPDLLGRLDLITVDRSALRVTDFKTSRGAWGNAKVEESAPQQLLYTELVRPLAESCGRPVEIEWIVLTKGKEPAVHRHRLTPDPRDVARTKAVVRSVWQAIVAGHFYPSPSSMSCSTCPYRTACQNWEM